MSAAEVVSGTDAQKKTTVPRMFFQQIQCRPRAVAIAAGGRELTYCQLGILAEKVRWTLTKAAAKHGDVVALCIPPSAEFVAVALAIMSAGAVYLHRFAPVGNQLSTSPRCRDPCQKILERIRMAAACDKSLGPT
jgi:non-ribosomal peptide synthetase component F